MLLISGGKSSYNLNSANCCIAAIYKIAFPICIQCMPVGLFSVQRRSHLSINSSNAMLGQPRVLYGVDGFIAFLQAKSVTILAYNITRRMSGNVVVEFFRYISITQ